MPNVTYNVVAQVDGGLQNTFTLVMNNKGHLSSASGLITSTLVGDTNRNGWQQRKAALLGGEGYEGGHAAPSALGFIGERAGLFPHHEWQNRKYGTKNDEFSFSDTEKSVIDRVKRELAAGNAVDLTWEMTLKDSPDFAVPKSVKLEYFFGSSESAIVRFNNLKTIE